MTIVVVPERWLKDSMMHRYMKDLIVSHLIMMEFNIMHNLTAQAGNHYDDIYDEVKMMQTLRETFVFTALFKKPQVSWIPGFTGTLPCFHHSTEKCPIDREW